MTALPPKWLALLLGCWGVVGALMWGVAEGSFFFIVPDVIISLAALYAPRKSLQHLLAVTGGSLLAGALLYLWAMAAPQAAIATVHSVPFVANSMFEQVRNDYAAFGALALCQGPLSGIPYKVYAVLAPPVIPLGMFLLVSIPARLERLLVSWLIFAVAGRLLQRSLQQRPNLGLWLHGIYWGGVYLFYWGSL